MPMLDYIGVLWLNFTNKNLFKIYFIVHYSAVKIIKNQWCMALFFKAGTVRTVIKDLQNKNSQWTLKIYQQVIYML